MNILTPFKPLFAALTFAVSISFGAGFNTATANSAVNTSPLDANKEFHFRQIPMGELELEGDLIGSINAITRGPNGYMWFGGDNGLARYDGKFFKVYRHVEGDEGSISNNAIRELLVDSDNVLWIGTYRGLNRYHPASDSFSVILKKGSQEPGEYPSLSGNFALSIAEAPNKELYIATEAGLTILSADRKRTQFVLPSMDYDYENTNHITNVTTTSAGEVFLGTFRHGLHRLRKDRSAYEPLYPNLSSSDFSHGHFVTDILEDSRGNLWVTSLTKPVIKINQQGEITAFEPKLEQNNTLNSRVTFRVYEDNEGQIWIATDKSGFYIYSPETGGFSHVSNNPYDQNSLKSGQVRSFYQDERGDIWVGTFAAGVSFHNSAMNAMKTFYVRPDVASLIDNGVLSIFQSDEEKIWIGTEKGLSLYNPKSGQFTNFNTENTEGKLVSETVLSISEDKHGMLWLGTTLAGLHSLNPNTLEIKHYGGQVSTPSPAGENFIWKVLIDDQGIWTGTLYGGLNRYDLYGQLQQAYTADINKPFSLKSNHVSRIVQDKRGYLWVGGLEGLAVFNPNEKKFRYKIYNEAESSKSNSRIISALYRDKQDKIWAAVLDQGVHIFDETGQQIHTLSKASGLRMDSINSFVEDDFGNIWAAGQNGILKINKTSYDIQLFQKHHGLVSNNHNRDASIKSMDGKLWFGSAEGVTVIDPNKLDNSGDASPIRITAISVNGKVISPQHHSPLVNKAAGFVHNLDLNHNHTSFGFQYALLNYRSPEYNRYAYFLEGFDKEWSSETRNNSVIYNNIPPGDYQFKVKGVDLNGTWSDIGTPVQISIAPAPWLTWWAYCLYAIAVLFILALVINAKRKQLELEKERAINDELKQVSKLKNTFLANTSHELRTPLNGIIGIAEYLSEQLKPLQKPEVHQSLKLLDVSGKRLLSLINDLLDFSRLEQKKLVVNCVPLRITPIASHAIDMASPQIGDKPIEIINQLKDEESWVLADPLRLKKIFSNLLNNAIKYTEKGTIVISNTIDKEVMKIEIKDTGTGIEAHDLAHVFDVFEQNPKDYGQEQGGVGVGLAITKQLIELQNGTIKVDSQTGVGSTFTFTLPLAEGHSIEGPSTVNSSSLPSSIDENAFNRTSESSRATILVVDDDPVNRMVLHAILSQFYNIVEAADGQIALDIIGKDTEVDLIVMDIMMPKLNGFEACKKIRENFGKNQLPIIFVTARQVEDDIAVGYEVGGNDFVEKPVSKHELLPRIQNYLDSRK